MLWLRLAISLLHEQMVEMKLHVVKTSYIVNVGRWMESTGTAMQTYDLWCFNVTGNNACRWWKNFVKLPHILIKPQPSGKSLFTLSHLYS